MEPWEGDFVRLLTDVKFKDSTGKIWLAPAGWVLDGASIPWVFQCVFKPFDKRYFASSTIHDVRFCVQDATFKRSNQLFRECLEAQEWKYPGLFYTAVSSPFGWYSYNYIKNLEVNKPLEEVVRKFNEDQAIRRAVFAGYP